MNNVKGLIERLFVEAFTSIKITLEENDNATNITCYEALFFADISRMLWMTFYTSSRGRCLDFLSNIHVNLADFRYSALILWNPEIFYITQKWSGL